MARLDFAQRFRAFRAETTSCARRRKCDDAHGKPRNNVNLAVVYYVLARVHWQWTAALPGLPGTLRDRILPPMNDRSSNNWCAKAANISRLTTHCLQAAVLVWLCATLVLTSPGVALLVAANPCEADAPEESERASIDESCASSTTRRTCPRQLICRRILISYAAIAPSTPPPAAGSQRRHDSRPMPDAQLGAGVPLRC
jgi:hypothetical protein